MRLDLMAEFNELKKKEEARKENESDMQLLMLDTSIVNEAQREIHAKMIEEVKSRCGWNLSLETSCLFTIIWN